ncbi:unnamed protein product [Agarophyton chilense]|eukprot:gb/GEZJ01002304.1/.p1 GENE.gb/GEZJ01002304.1/~~gb/GEZJ01002304.1/.p1  ORF type:complete len:807 (-),score=97.41 gb/GEZJ01002304.1/:2831-5251(-)
METHCHCRTQAAPLFLSPTALPHQQRRWANSRCPSTAQRPILAHQARPRFSPDIQRAAALRRAGKLDKARDVLHKASPDTRRHPAYYRELMSITTALVAQSSSAAKAEQLWCALEPLLLQDYSRPDSLSFNRLLSALRLLDSRRQLTKRNENEELRILLIAQRIFDFMRDISVRPDQFTMSILFNMCAYRASERFAVMFEQQATDRFDFKPNVVSGSALLAAFAKAGSLEQLDRVVNLLREKQVPFNERSYTSIISAHLKHGQHVKVLQYFDQAIACPSVTPNVFLFSGVLTSCLRVRDAVNGLRVFEVMQQKKVHPTEAILNLMVELAARTGNIPLGVECITKWAPKYVTASEAFDRDKIIASWKRNPANPSNAIDALHKVLQYIEGKGYSKGEMSTYNAALSTLVALGMIDHVEEFLERIRRRGLAPDLVTYNILMHSYGTAGNLNQALGVLRDMKQNRVKPDQITFNTLLDLLLKSGEVDKVESLLQEMEHDEKLEIDAVGRCIQLKVYRIQGNKQAALQVHNTTQRLDKPLDAKAYGLLLSILFEFDEHEQAISIFGWLVWKRQAAGPVYNVMIDNIGKREDGCEQCMKLFNHMKRRGIPPDKLTYTTMIRVLSKSGLMDRAFRLLSEMQDIGLAMSDMYAWTSLMDGFRRCGQWQRAVELLAFMKKHSSKSKYSLVPRPSTACYNAALYAAGIGGQHWKTCVKIYNSLLADEIQRPDYITYSAMASILLRRRRRISEWHIVRQVCQALEELLLEDNKHRNDGSKAARTKNGSHQSLSKPVRKKLLSKLSDLKTLIGPEINH